mmetsp:Transcript_10251/g.30284  ORF Transcript_10251/g.30284 Transcript_10251/m.30284 type:complete len:389 (-) Transcript_10251:230-1396(-)
MPGARTPRSTDPPIDLEVGSIRAPEEALTASTAIGRVPHVSSPLDVAAEPPSSAQPADHGDTASPTGNEESYACLICLEDEVTEGEHMFHDICACKNTAIHRTCLEKLVNSRRRRKLELDERLACPVCTRQYKVPYERTLIARQEEDWVPEGRGRGNPSAARSLASALLLSFAAAFGVRVLVETLGQQVAFLIVTIFVFAFMFYIVYGTKRHRRRRAADDPEDLDDEQFYTDIVGSHRDQLGAAAAAPNAEALDRARNHRVIIHIGVGAGPGGSLISAPASEEAAQAPGTATDSVQALDPPAEAQSVTLDVSSEIELISSAGRVEGLPAQDSVSTAQGAPCAAAAPAAADVAVTASPGAMPTGAAGRQATSAGAMAVVNVHVGDARVH